MNISYICLNQQLVCVCARTHTRTHTTASKQLFLTKIQGINQLEYCFLEHLLRSWLNLNIPQFLNFNVNFFTALGIELRISFVLGKHSTTELYLQPPIPQFLYFSKVFLHT